MPAETHSHRGPSTGARSSASCASSSPRSSRSTPTRSRPTAHLRDDLDADDYALIELVEGGRGRARRADGRAHDRRRRSRRVAHRARRGRVRRRRPRCGRGRVVTRHRRPSRHDAESPRSTGRVSTRSRRRSACASTTASLLLGSLAHRSWCAEHGESRVERAPRVPRRLRARSRRDALRVRELSRTFPKASSRRCAPAS